MPGKAATTFLDPLYSWQRQAERNEEIVGREIHPQGRRCLPIRAELTLGISSATASRSFGPLI
jgi:hypothetical protein